MMRTKRRPLIVLLSLLLLGSLPRVSSAAAGLPVIEVGAALAQQTITAVNAVAQTANWVIDLTPLEEIVLLDGIAEDLAALSEIVADARGLSWDIRQLDAQFDFFFDYGGLPGTAAEYAWRRGQTAQFILDGARYAMKAQTLVRTTQRTIDHLLGLIEGISNAFGNLQISGVASQAQDKLIQIMAEQKVTTAAFERLEATVEADMIGAQESVRFINRNVWSTWPGMVLD